MKEGFSDGTLVLEDGMSGGGGLVGLVVGRRTPSGILVITWCGAGWRTWGKKIVHEPLRSVLSLLVVREMK